MKTHAELFGGNVQRPPPPSARCPFLLGGGGERLARFSRHDLHLFLFLSSRSFLLFVDTTPSVLCPRARASGTFSHSVLQRNQTAAFLPCLVFTAPVAHFVRPSVCPSCPAANTSGGARECHGAQEVFGRGAGGRRTGEGGTAGRALLCAAPRWRGGEQIAAPVHACADARTRGTDARTAGVRCPGDPWKGVCVCARARLEACFACFVLFCFVFRFFLWL